MKVYGVFYELLEYTDDFDEDYKALRCIFDTLEKAEDFIACADRSENYVIEEIIMNSEEERGK